MAEEKAMTKQDVAEMVTSSIASSMESLGRVLKEPTKAEARKINQEELLQKRTAEARRNEGIKSQEAKDAEINRCRRAGHVIAAPGAKGALRHGWRGAVNGDGCIRPSCIACHLTLPPFKAPDPVRYAGASVNEWFESLVLTEEILIQWSKTSNPEHWEREAKRQAERAEFIKAFRMENEEAGIVA